MLVGALLVAPLVLADPAGSDLREQLRYFSEAERFTVHGLAHVSGASAKRLPRHQPTVEALKVILEGFDYLVLSRPDGEISEVRILGRSQQTGPAAPPPRVAVPTRRDRGYHELDVRLVGPNGRPLAAALVLDTGATTVVLPTSMMAGLGFGEGDLTAGWAATAGGRVRVWNGTLPSLAVGDAEVSAVAVSFIDDARLGARGLLGLSFLSRFKLVVDDAANEIVLMAK